jgi:hypothetical protein
MEYGYTTVPALIAPVARKILGWEVMLEWVYERG